MPMPQSQNTVLGEVDSLSIHDFTGLDSPTDAETHVVSKQRNGVHNAWECLTRLLDRQATGFSPCATLNELCPNGM